jgi:hypothetical protein
MSAQYPFKNAFKSNSPHPVVSKESRNAGKESKKWVRGLPASLLSLDILPSFLIANK